MKRKLDLKNKFFISLFIILVFSLGTFYFYIVITKSVDRDISVCCCDNDKCSSNCKINSVGPDDCRKNGAICSDDACSGNGVSQKCYPCNSHYGKISDCMAESECTTKGGEPSKLAGECNCPTQTENKCYKKYKDNGKTAYDCLAKATCDSNGGCSSDECSCGEVSQTCAEGDTNCCDPGASRACPTDKTKIQKCGDDRKWGTVCQDNLSPGTTICCCCQLSGGTCLNKTASYETGTSGNCDSVCKDKGKSNNADGSACKDLSKPTGNDCATYCGGKASKCLSSCSGDYATPQTNGDSYCNSQTSGTKCCCAGSGGLCGNKVQDSGEDCDPPGTTVGCTANNGNKGFKTCGNDCKWMASSSSATANSICNNCYQPEGSSGATTCNTCLDDNSYRINPNGHCPSSGCSCTCTDGSQVIEVGISKYCCKMKDGSLQIQDKACSTEGAGCAIDPGGTCPSSCTNGCTCSAKSCIGYTIPAGSCCYAREASMSNPQPSCTVYSGNLCSSSLNVQCTMDISGKITSEQPCKCGTESSCYGYCCKVGGNNVCSKTGCTSCTGSRCPTAGTCYRDSDCGAFKQGTYGTSKCICPDGREAIDISSYCNFDGVTGDGTCSSPNMNADQKKKCEDECKNQGGCDETTMSCKGLSQTCNDGTALGQCVQTGSSSYGMMCNEDGTLTWKQSCCTDTNYDWTGGKCVSKAGAGPSYPPCSDGTPWNQCSTTQPKFCTANGLIDACGGDYKCGCPSDKACTKEGTCGTPGISCRGENSFCVWPFNNCCDGLECKKTVWWDPIPECQKIATETSPTNPTNPPIPGLCPDNSVPGLCSANLPKFCTQDKTLVDKCDQCGCPADKPECGTDGFCRKAGQGTSLTGKPCSSPNGADGDIYCTSDSSGARTFQCHDGTWSAVQTCPSKQCSDNGQTCKGSCSQTPGVGADGKCWSYCGANYQCDGIEPASCSNCFPSNTNAGGGCANKGENCDNRACCDEVNNYCDMSSKPYICKAKSETPILSGCKVTTDKSSYNIGDTITASVTGSSTCQCPSGCEMGIYVFGTSGGAVQTCNSLTTGGTCSVQYIIKSTDQVGTWTAGLTDSNNRFVSQATFTVTSAECNAYNGNCKSCLGFLNSNNRQACQYCSSGNECADATNLGICLSGWIYDINNCPK